MQTHLLPNDLETIEPLQTPIESPSDRMPLIKVPEGMRILSIEKYFTTMEAPPYVLFMLQERSEGETEKELSETDIRSWAEENFPD